MSGQSWWARPETIRVYIVGVALALWKLTKGKKAERQAPVE